MVGRRDLGKGSVMCGRGGAVLEVVEGLRG